MSCSEPLAPWGHLLMSCSVCPKSYHMECLGQKKYAVRLITLCWWPVSCFPYILILSPSLTPLISMVMQMCASLLQTNWRCPDCREGGAAHLDMCLECGHGGDLLCCERYGV
jgi:hypothetical protein